MKAGIVISGSGPILVLTSYDDLSNIKFSEKLAQKGITKYLAVEVPLEICKEKYGQHYYVILEDVKQQDDLRVLDCNGFNIFHNFPFSTWGKEYRHD